MSSEPPTVDSSSLSGVSSRHRILLGAILAFALALRLALFIGYARVDPVDDAVYLRLARETASVRFAEQLDTLLGRPLAALGPADAFIFRRGTILPIVAFQRLLGPGEVAAAMPSLTASLATLLAVYALGLLLASSEVGLLAALIFAVAPLDVAYSTRIGAEAPQLWWVTASVLATLLARHSPRGWKRISWFAISGLSFYLAYLTRVSALLALPVLSAAAIPELRARRFDALLPTLLFLSLGAGQSLWYSWHAWAIVIPLELEAAAQRGGFARLPQALYYPFGAWSHLVVHSSYVEGVPHYFFKLLAGTVQHYRGVVTFSSLSVLGSVALMDAARRRTFLLLCFWLVFIFVSVQYGFKAIEWDGVAGELHYYLISPRPRYLILLLPPLCLLIADLVNRLLSRHRSAGLALLLAVIGPCLWHAVSNYHFYRESLADMRAAGRFLLQQQPGDIVTDSLATEEIDYFAGYRLSPRDDGGAPRMLVVGGSRGFDFESTFVASGLSPPYAQAHLDADAIDPSWELVFERKAELQPARATNLRIYRLPAP